MGLNEDPGIMEGLVNLLSKSNYELTMLQHRLDKEFQQTYPHNANPTILVSRIKRIQDDLSTLTDQCRQLLTAKQDLVDKARSTLIRNRTLLQRMHESLGIHPTNDSDDSAFANFNQAIDEWTAHVRSKTGDEMHDSDSEDVNKLLFSAVVQSN